MAVLIRAEMVPVLTHCLIAAMESLIVWMVVMKINVKV